MTEHQAPLWAAYFADGDYAGVKEFGFDMVWLNAFVLEWPENEPALAVLRETGMKIILHLFWTEGRLVNPHVFRKWITFVRARLDQLGLTEQVIAVQFDDEFYERISTNTPWFVTNEEHWPVTAQFDACKDRMPGVARLHAERIKDFEAVWGGIPTYGFGVSVTGAFLVPTFEDQDWWGCDFYVGLGGQSPQKVRDLYAAVALTGLRFQMVLPFFSEPGYTVPTVPTLAATYEPIYVRHKAQVWSIGVFAWTHPGHATDGSRGLCELPEEYRNFVKRSMELSRRPPSREDGYAAVFSEGP